MRYNTIMKPSTLNPQPGELLKELIDNGASRSWAHWVVTDFLPWGFEGKHAWVVCSPTDGKKKVILKTHLTFMEKVSE